MFMHQAQSVTLSEPVTHNTITLYTPLGMSVILLINHVQLVLRIDVFHQHISTGRFLIVSQACKRF